MNGQRIPRRLIHISNHLASFYENSNSPPEHMQWRKTG
jgi:hypothetical protein